MKRIWMLAIMLMVAFAATAGAQAGPGAGRGPQAAAPPCSPPMGGPGMGMGPGMGPGMAPGMGHGPGMGPGLSMGMGPRGKWWNNSELVKRLGLTDAQVQQIENIFQSHRTQLIDFRAALEKQEVALEPLVEAERPNEGQVTAQIDRVAQARASLEKSNAQMMLAIRRVLTLAQWKQLRSEGMKPMPGPRGGGPPAGR